MNSTIRNISAGLDYIVKTRLLGQQLPLMAGIAINDNCNLRCRHCSVAGRGLPDMNLEEIKSALEKLAAMGIHFLYIEGGEPFLWKDGDKNLEDILRLARDLGFRHCFVYTNGTFPLETSADTLFVSIDGLIETHNRLRGNTYDRILSNIRTSDHPRIFINFTINSENQHEIEEFCHQMHDIGNIKGIYFYFYTPSTGKSELFIDQEKKLLIISRILTLKKQGHIILNSRAALLATGNGKWKRPDSLGYLYADGKLFRCCRYIDIPGACENCGYLGYAELYLISRLNISALLAATRYL